MTEENLNLDGVEATPEVKLEDATTPVEEITPEVDAETEEVKEEEVSE